MSYVVTMRSTPKYNQFESHDADNIECSYKLLSKQAFQMIKANLERSDIKTPFKVQIF